MSFAEHKFRGLDARAQAKKLADRLGRLLREGAALSSSTRKALLSEYAGLLANARPELGADAGASVDAMDQRAIYDAYIHWRRKAGLGPEESVTQAVQSRATQASVSRVGYSVWLHNLRSGHNVGAIIRTAEYFGFERVYLSGYTPGPEQRAVQAAAMGCAEWIACERLGPADSGDPAKAAQMPGLPADLPILALESPEYARDPELGERHVLLGAPDAGRGQPAFTWPERALIVPGNEELGVPREILSRATAILSVPRYGRKSSLNVSSAFAVVAAQLRANMPGPSSKSNPRGER